MSFNITDPIFTDADKAREHLEAQRWPDGAYCPHCGNADQERIRKMEGEKHRPGLYNCRECRKQFSVTVGTVFERSKIRSTSGCSPPTCSRRPRKACRRTNCTA